MGLLSNYLPLVAGVSVSAVYVTLRTLKETIFLEQYRKLFASHSRGREIPIEKPVKEKFEEVMEDLKVPSNIREKLKVFNTPFCDLLHFGLFIDKYGGAVGVPAYFNYTDAATVVDKNIHIGNTDVDWHNEIGKKLAESLILSADAQKYAIACEIKKLFYNEEFVFAGIYSLYMITMCAFYNIFSKKQKLSEKRFLRILTICTLMCVGILNYKIMVSLTKHGNNMDVDTELCKLGPKYIQGGKEYYEKLLVRNEILADIDKNVKWVVPFTKKTKASALEFRKSFFETELENLTEVV